MAIRERVSLYRRYQDDRVFNIEPFRTYYIIMEGTNTEPIYFRLLEKKLFEKRIHNNIKLIFLERTLRDRGSNTPYQLLNYLKQIKTEESNCVNYLIVFDRDSFKTSINQANSYLSFIEEAKSNNIKMLITSPCFEIWLLLHQNNVYNSFIKPNEKFIFENKRVSPSYTYISKLVRDIYGFNPKATIPSNFIDNLEIALKEAKNLEKDISKFSNSIGENISLFIEELLLDPRLIKLKD